MVAGQGNGDEQVGFPGKALIEAQRVIVGEGLDRETKGHELVGDDLGYIFVEVQSDDEDAPGLQHHLPGVVNVRGIGEIEQAVQQQL